MDLSIKDTVDFPNWTNVNDTDIKTRQPTNRKWLSLDGKHTIVLTLNKTLAADIICLKIIDIVALTSNFEILLAAYTNATNNHKGIYQMFR